ncbi:MAG: hypothetical protein WB770_11730 [Acidimicrobiales bacterium]
MAIRNRKTRSLGALLAMLIGSSVLVAVLAGTAAVAGATPSPGTAGIKICKVWTASSIASATGPFVFWIKGPSYSDGIEVDVSAGQCVETDVWEAGTYTVTEAYADWYQVTNIAELDNLGDVSFPTDQSLPGNSPADLVSYVAITSDQVSAGDEVTVQYTNDLVTGNAEICKAQTPGDTLSGPFTFALTNTNDEASGSGGLSFDIPETLNVGGCTGNITVPAGVLEVTEAGTNLYVTSITATLDNTSENELGYHNLTDGASESWVYPDSQVTTVVTYTNDTVGLEVCKAWDGDPYSQPQGTATTYSFSETATNPNGDGPATAPSSFTLNAGGCNTPTQYAPGTIVKITEGVTPGTEVRAITPSGALTTVPDNDSDDPDLANRTVTVVVGADTTTGTPSNSATVTFTDGIAYPSTLKICKDLAADETASAPFTFTVSGPQYVPEYQADGTATPGWFFGEIANGSFTVSVPAGECEFATPTVSSKNPSYLTTNWFDLLPYNSTQTITESGTTNFAATNVAISSSFTDVSVYEGGVFTPTTEPVLSNISLGTTGGTSSANVTMSEGASETIVTWTNMDPPPAAPHSTGSVTVANPGAPNAGTTTAKTLPIATAVAAAVSKLDAPGGRVALTRDEHTVTRLNRTISRIEKSLKSHKLTRLERSRDLKQLRQLRARMLHFLVLIYKLTR